MSSWWPFAASSEEGEGCKTGNRTTDIAAYRLNRPRGPLSKNCKKAVVDPLKCPWLKNGLLINNSSYNGHKTDLVGKKKEHFPIAQSWVRLLGNP